MSSSRPASARPAKPPVQHGPQVRAAGRIVLRRPSGKVHWLQIRDWTGTIQVMIGKNQVGDENWELAQCFDLGDIIGVDGEFHRTMKGELTIFADRPAFSEQVDRNAAGKMGRAERSRTSAADALSRSDPHRRRARTLFAADEDRAVDPQHAGRRRDSSRSKGRRCTPSPAERPPGRSPPITTPWTSISICGSPWNCI